MADEELFNALPTQISIAKQIECIKRELNYRRYVYPKRIGMGKMTTETAHYQIACMEAVLATLEGVKP